MEPYRHETLEPDLGSIRTLTVLPQDPDGKVRCTISHTTLETSFSALSYTWGKPNATKEILINGRSFAVRQNLFDFLCMLSKHRPGGRLWIDAICIDQINDAEKSHQVLQMGSIYAAAQDVLVWLGKDEALQNWFGALNGHGWSDTPEGVNMPLGRRAWLDGFKHLMIHPYWTRLWITQELLLSRNAKLLAGNSMIPLNFFKLQYNLYRLDARKVLDPDKTARIFMLLARKFEGDKHFTPHSLGVRAAFAVTVDSLCHDSRDRIFGLVSLMEGGQSFPLRYSDSEFAVFLRAIVQFNDKYMSCLLLDLLNPRPKSIHADLKELLKSEEDLNFDDVNLLRLEQVTRLGWSELCHQHLRGELTAIEQRYIWCIELLPKKNWQDKYLNHSTTLHVIFEEDTRTGVYRSVEAVCQRDIDSRHVKVAESFANLILGHAQKAVRGGAVTAAKPLKAKSDRPDREGECVQVTFPLACLSQFFWYLLNPQVRQEDERNGIDIFDGMHVFRVGQVECHQSKTTEKAIRPEGAATSSKEHVASQIVGGNSPARLTTRILKGGRKKLMKLLDKQRQVSEV